MRGAHFQRQYHHCNTREAEGCRGNMFQSMILSKENYQDGCEQLNFCVPHTTFCWYILPVVRLQSCAVTLGLSFQFMGLQIREPGSI